MMNEQNAKDFQQLEDQHLENVAGGYGTQTGWMEWRWRCEKIHLPQIEQRRATVPASCRDASEEYYQRAYDILRKSLLAETDVVGELRQLLDEFNWDRRAVDNNVGFVLNDAIREAERILR